MKSEVMYRSTTTVLLVCLMIIDAWAFGVGDTVKVTANTNVRTGPSTSHPEITDPDYPGTARAGTVGKITAGSQIANGYTWWRVDFGPGSYSGWAVQEGFQVAAPSQPPVARVALTLYVYEGSVTGPLIPGARVTGQDGGGSNFDQTTNSSGYVTVFGLPGTWRFVAAKDSYQPNSWSQDISSTCTRYAFLQKPTDSSQSLNAPAPAAPAPASPQESLSCTKSSDLHGSQVDLSRWGWTNPLPLENMYVSSYGGFMDPKYAKAVDKNHLGVDLLGLADLAVPVGTPVLAICSGRVDGKLNTGSYNDVYQSAIFIVADSGVALVYGHVRDPRDGPLVKIGDCVAAGQRIGEIGPITYDGAWPRSHLHLGINVKGTYYYNYPEKTSGWGIAPRDATTNSAMQKGWVDPVVYFCEHHAKTTSEGSSGASKGAASILGKWVYANDSRMAEITTLQFEQDRTVLMSGPMGSVQPHGSSYSCGQWQLENDSKMSFRFFPFTGHPALTASAQVEGSRLKNFKMGGFQPGLPLMKSTNAQRIKVAKKSLWNEYVSDAPGFVWTMLLRLRQDGNLLAIQYVKWNWKMLGRDSVQVYMHGPTRDVIENRRFRLEGNRLVDDICGASYRRVASSPR